MLSSLKLTGDRTLRRYLWALACSWPKLGRATASFQGEEKLSEFFGWEVRTSQSSHTDAESHDGAWPCMTYVRSPEILLGMQTIQYVAKKSFTIQTFFGVPFSGDALCSLAFRWLDMVGSGSVHLGARFWGIPHTPYSDKPKYHTKSASYIPYHIPIKYPFNIPIKYMFKHLYSGFPRLRVIISWFVNSRSMSDPLRISITNIFSWLNP